MRRKSCLLHHKMAPLGLVVVFVVPAVSFDPEQLQQLQAVQVELLDALLLRWPRVQGLQRVHRVARRTQCALLHYWMAPLDLVVVVVIVVAVGGPEQLQQLQAVQKLLGALLLRRSRLQWQQQVRRDIPQVPLPLLVPRVLPCVVVDAFRRRVRGRRRRHPLLGEEDEDQPTQLCTGSYAGENLSKVFSKVFWPSLDFDHRQIWLYFGRSSRSQDGFASPMTALNGAPDSFVRPLFSGRNPLCLALEPA